MAHLALVLVRTLGLRRGRRRRRRRKRKRRRLRVEVSSWRGATAVGDVRERDFVKNSAVILQSGMWLYAVSHIHTCLSLSSPDSIRF